MVLYFFGPGMGVSYDPLTPPSPFTNFATYYSCSNWSEGGGCEPPPSQPPAVDNASFRLVFPVQDTIQLSFSNLIGYEPAIAPPVPEPSTWIMMILGFTAFGVMTYRRNRIGMRRIIFTATILICFSLFGGQGNAAAFVIDPTIGGTEQSIPYCYPCVLEYISPLYSFHAGDSADFGALTLGPIYSGHSGFRGSATGGYLISFGPIPITDFAMPGYFDFCYDFGRWPVFTSHPAGTARSATVYVCSRQPVSVGLDRTIPTYRCCPRALNMGHAADRIRRDRIRCSPPVM